MSWPGWRECTAYRQPGLGGLPLALRLSEYEGLPRPEATRESHSIEVPRLRCRVIKLNWEGKSWKRLLPSASKGRRRTALRSLAASNEGLQPGIDKVVWTPAAE